MSQVDGYENQNDLIHDVNGLMACVVMEVEALSNHADDTVRVRAASLMRATERVRDYCAAARRGGDARLPYQDGLRLSSVLDDVGSILTLIAAPVDKSIEVHSENFRLSGRDAIAVHRMVMNLGRNAISAMTAHRGTALSINAVHDRGRLSIDVVDDGPGLPRHVLDRLFPSIGQRRLPEGRIGLGIPATQRLARAMGGELRLLSSNNQGTAFQISLPLADTAPPPRRVIPHLQLVQAAP